MALQHGAIFRGYFLTSSYGVRWTGQDKTAVQLVSSVVESSTEFDRETRAFQYTLRTWLGAVGALLLLSQTLL